MKDKRWLKRLFRERVTVAVLLVMQVALLVYSIISRSRTSQVFGMAMTVMSFFVALHIAFQPRKTVYKVSWIVLVLSFPLFGGLLYLLLFLQSSNKRLRRTAEEEQRSRDFKHLPGDAMEEFQQAAPDQLPQARYLQDYAGFPVYSGTKTRYLSPGEAAFPIILEELEKAEHYIFLEFFILEEGVLWDSILEILKRKAAQDVKVRLLYDDIGCFLLLPKNYPQTLRSFGIECVAFNPFRPLLTASQNNRDHRKIISIDGKTAFTGGMNLADEYINTYEKHGYWKDASIMVQGKAAWSFTVMFLEMWQVCTRVREDPMDFYPQAFPEYTDGFVQPYADSPADEEYVGEYVYLQMIHNARDYVYIDTPYLVIDDNMMTALSLAAKSGVDVRIVTPHVWDKKIVHMTTRSYYKELLDAGVKIYEYTPGFMHAKVMLSDDASAVIGTINLDYRSLYLHFECGVRLQGCAAIHEAKADFLKTLEDCQPITPEMCKMSLLQKLRSTFLRLAAPFM